MYDYTATFHAIETGADGRTHVAHVRTEHGTTHDVERTVFAVSAAADDLADLTGTPIDWTVHHRPTGTTGARSSWSGYARPGNRDRAPFTAVAIV